MSTAIKRAGPGGSAQGLLLAGLLTLLVIASLWLFLQRAWWFPTLASAHGADSDDLFYITLAVTGVLFVLLQLILAYFAWQYRDGKAEFRNYRTNRRAEIRFALVAAIIIFAVDVTLASIGERAFLKVYGASPANALNVEVTGEQFAWNIRYPGKDGTFGATDLKQISSGNPLGLDANDPVAKDDIVLVNQLHMPLNRPVRIQLKSRDVIHSFFIPNFRIRQDAVPGMTIGVWLVPTKAGEYELACTQLCGLAHYRMRGLVTVEPQQDFDRWLNEQATEGGR